MSIITNDFRYMWQGKHLGPLLATDAHVLAPIAQKNSRYEHALLLLHGFSSSPAVYRELLPGLSHYDAIVCPALPGNGQNLSEFSASKASDWITPARETCDTLLKQYQHVDVMGFSLGGLLACDLSQHFSLNHLYLLAPALSLQLNIPWALAAARVLHSLGFQSLRNRAGHLLSPHHCELAYRQLPLATIIQLLTLIKNFVFTPPTCPTDLFLGYGDDVIDGHHVEKLFTNLPNCTIHWLAQSAHILPLDNDKDEIIACVQHNTNT